MNDVAFEHFERLRTMSDVNALVKRRVPEGLHLEYKTVSTPFRPEDRSNICATVSAFANSDGGVLLLGVVTGKAADRNVPVGLKRLVGLPERVEDVHEAIGQGLQSLPDGIQIKAVGRGSGIIAVLVPASKSPPHMYGHQYYQRHGSTSQPMEHYQVMDILGRRRSPILFVDVSTRDWGPTSVGVSGSFDFRVRNTGRGLARHPTVHAVVSVTPLGRTSQISVYAPFLTPLKAHEDAVTAQTVLEDRVVYPPTKYSEFSIELGLIYCHVAPVVRIHVSWAAYAEDMEAQFGACAFDVDEHGIRAIADGP